MFFGMFRSKLKIGMPLMNKTQTSFKTVLIFLFRISLLIITILASFQFALSQERQELAAPRPFYLSYEQRVMMSYLVLAAGASNHEIKDIATRWKNFISNQLHNVEVRTIEVKSFEDFLQKFKGEWPDSHSLNEDLTLIEHKNSKESSKEVIRYVGKTQKVQAQIYDYLTYQQAKFEDLIKSELPQKTSELLFNSILPLLKSTNKTNIGDLSETEIKTAITALNQKIDLVPQTAFEYVLTSASDKVIKKIKEIDTAGEVVSVELSKKMQNQMIQIYFSTLINEYFKRLKMEYKKEMASQFLGQNLEMSSIEKFKIMVQNSGPIFQKFLQVGSLSQDLPSELQEILKALQASVRPVPNFKIKKILENETHNYQIKNFDKEPIGVGTMNQAHRAKVIHPVTGEPINVVFQFQKPGAATKIIEDERIFTEIAKIMDSRPDLIKMSAPKISPIVTDIVNGARAELNRKDTIERHKQGVKSYSGQTDWLMSSKYKTKIIYRVPEIIDPITENSHVIVSELVQGESLDKAAESYRNLAPDMKRLVIESLVGLWVKTSFFGNGFYHSDLHPGNIIVRVTDEAIIVNIIDYGMGGTLTEEQMRQSFILGAGLELRYADVIAKSLWKLSNDTENKISLQDFTKLIKEKITEIKVTGIYLSLNQWIGWATQKGIVLDYNYINLQRGVTILNQTLEAYSSPLTVIKMISEQAKKTPYMIYKFVDHPDSGLTKFDLLKLGWINFVDKKRSLVHQKGMVPTYISGQIQCKSLF